MTLHKVIFVPGPDICRSRNIVLLWMRRVCNVFFNEIFKTLFPMWMWSNEHCVLLMLAVPVTLDKSLHLVVCIPVYKMSSSQICSEDSLVNVYKVLWRHKYGYYFNDSELYEIKRASYPLPPYSLVGGYSNCPINKCSIHINLYTYLLSATKCLYNSTRSLAIHCLWVLSIL